MGPPMPGCSSALGTAQPLVGANFLPTCSALDQCYGECGAPQAGCDAAFLSDMQSACLSQIPAVDAEAQRMSLSLKAAVAKPEKADDKAKDKPEVEEPPRELAVPKRSGPLRGGAGKKSAGEQFGLNW